MTLQYNCKFFKGDIPCHYHKEEDVVCDECPHFASKSKKILIIKLSAIGDVLRTTFILKGLRKKYSNAYIAWITHPSARQLLIGNELIDEIIDYDLTTIARLLVEEFDLVFNPSNERESSILASLARAKRKFGFVYDKRGHIRPIGSMAKIYLFMGTNDVAKKKNKMTYQKIVSDMIGLKRYNSKPILNLSAEDMAFARRFKEAHALGDQFVVGLNINAGKRWQLKKWPIEKTIELAKQLSQELKTKVILFGGPEEELINREIMHCCGSFLIDAGCKNSLREFAGLISLVDVLVTSDSLGLHIATTLNKYVVALFGPTSHHEVELYNRGIKITSQGMDCLGCYKNTCSTKPNCMDRISVREVLLAVEKFKNNMVC